MKRIKTIVCLLIFSSFVFELNAIRFVCSPTNGGTINSSNISAVKASPAAGYVFSKFVVDINGTKSNITVNPYDCSQTIIVESMGYGEPVVTAYFVKATSYILTVKSNNTTYGTVSGGGTYTSGTSVTIKATPKTGYKFVQWNDGNTSASRSVTVTKAITYTATFSASTYTVTFNANGGTTSTASKTVTYASTYGTLPKPTRTGYVFVGWYTTKTGTDAVISSTKVTKTANHTLYAQWVTTTEKILPGLFSVSSTKLVRFASGNLQYTAQGTHQCVDGTQKQGLWRFAEHQYDTIGSKNNNTSSSYGGWIDLFGFGNSGWNSGASCYQPYTHSQNYMDYINHDLVGSYANADYGIYNAIVNGGNAANSWRLLSKNELNWMLSNRADCQDKRAVGCVNNIPGIILLPDNWNLPAGVTFKSGFANSAGLANYKTVNNYTLAQWNLMEQNGAVFLPYSGYTSKLTDNYVYSNSSYYTTYSTSTNGFDSTYYKLSTDGFFISVNCNDKDKRNYGPARLIQYVYEVRANNPNYGDVSITGNNKIGNTIAISATPKNGYRFLQWDDGSTQTTRQITLTNNPDSSSIYTAIFATSSVDTTEHVLFGRFSTSDTTYVCFASGNLQYLASCNIWRFAEHQYDYEGVSNIFASSSYNGWIDLFCWGTSGWNSGAKCYQPWDTSSVVTDFLSLPLQSEKSHADWGVHNPIVNGGNVAGKWRCPTANEWQNILFDRKNASSLRSLATVNNIEGMILLPDSFDLPNNLSFVPTMMKYSTNIYDLSQWEQMETNGAVFLPSEGFRTKELIIRGIADGHTGGWYYSSDTIHDANDLSHCMLLRFTEDSISIRNKDHGFYSAYGVRLVREMPQAIITGAGENGTVLGGGTLFVGNVASLIAEPNECYEFVQWSDGNTDNPRTITVTSNATYTAEFEKIKYKVSVSADNNSGTVDITKNK